jgi:hypothetical protein
MLIRAAQDNGLVNGLITFWTTLSDNVFRTSNLARQRFPDHQRRSYGSPIKIQNWWLHLNDGGKKGDGTLSAKCGVSTIGGKYFGGGLARNGAPPVSLLYGA